MQHKIIVAFWNPVYPARQLLYLGQTGNLACNRDAAVRRWMKDDMPIHPKYISPNFTLTITQASYEDAGVYQCLIWDSTVQQFKVDGIGQVFVGGIFFCVCFSWLFIYSDLCVHTSKIS